MKRRVAVVGAGISGLAAAWALRHEARVTLFEAEGRLGGHAHTVDLTLDGVTHGVDTGFLVFNQRTYPLLVGLFDELGVATAPSEMSFSVQDRSSGLEWSGSNLDSVFAQRRNLLSPRFLGMLADILRFNRLCTALAEAGSADAVAEPLGDFLARHRFGNAFRHGYLLPMLACIWSCPTDQMLQFPLATMIRFCHNHGLLQVSRRPQWYTVRGGSRRYVEALLPYLGERRTGAPVRAVRRLPAGQGAAGVQVDTDGRSEHFDDVVLACHSDQALALLADADAQERAILGAIRYRPNRAVLHTDASLLPQRRRAWAAWNYEGAADRRDEGAAGRGDEGAADRGESAGVCLHYLINRLQPLPWQRPVLVSLNPLREPDPAGVHGEYTYHHPVFDAAAADAQRRLGSIQGRSHLWFAGAWTRYGFHEDGLMSGLAAADGLRQRWAAGPTAKAA